MPWPAWPPSISKMRSAKEIILRPVTSREGNEFIKRVHYSGKTASNSQFHVGVFLDGSMEGCLQFGPSLDKSKIIGLVKDTKWNGFLELNRMAFTDALPKNSESRAISVSMRLLRKHKPEVEWIVSFADATQCGDGTIYRASGFVLTAIKKNAWLARLPSGEVIHKMTLSSNPTQPRPELGGRTFFDITGGGQGFKEYVKAAKAELLEGFQIRYIYFQNPAARARLAVAELPFSEIEKQGAAMYRGQKRGDSMAVHASGHPPEDGGSNPTSPLHSQGEK